MPAVVGLVILCGWIMGRNIARPIVAVTRSMEGLGRGELDTPVPEDTRRDEIGTMMQAVRGFRDSLRETAQLRAETAAERERHEAQKHAALQAMADRIESESTSTVQRIGERTDRMTTIAEDMLGLSQRAGDSARDAADAAATALANAEAVSSAAEELAASIREISAQVSHSTAVVGKAVEAGEETRTSIDTLNESVGRIGAVADIIGDIAAKTNLLALNATIEAARAGEAGKGFAVVAGEVKQLANQTARSTEEITRHISEVRAATTAAVLAVGRIGSTVGEVNEIATSITAAVEQQRAATAEIARNVTETASAVTAIGGRNDTVAQEAAQAKHYADDVLENARGLGAAIQDLRHALNRIVHTSTEEVDRRNAKRYEIDRGCRLEVPGIGVQTGRVIDLSEGGAALRGIADVTAGQSGTLHFDGLNAAVPCRIVKAADSVLHVAFDPSDSVRQAVAGLVAEANRREAA